MRRKCVGPSTLFTMLALPLPMLFGQGSIATNSATPLSTRVVAYQINARVDVKAKSVDATETLTYKNLTGQPLNSFPFHLYLNGFQPDSTFTTETHFGGGIRDSEAENKYDKKKLGSISISHLEADGFGDLTAGLRYIQPDDHNAADHTVAELALPRAVAPGESITFRIAFHDQFPESVARNGYKRDFLMGGQWFPKVGVFWHGSWNCHQYHATTEFFSDFGTYDVRLTLPKSYTVGATGVSTGDTLNADGTRTLAFYGEDIHDFAWAASPNFTVTDGTYLSALGPVRVRVLALRAHPEAGKRYLDILLASMKEFEQRYGPYPYKTLTLIDPEPGSEMGGMEYPTLITGDTSIWDPTHLTEITAEHEFGHQYWYGMVATNEFEDAWLDEGINSYTESIVTGAALGRDTSAANWGWASMSDLALHYNEYIAEPNYDPVTRHAWEFRNANVYGDITYGKSSALLHTLEGLIGRDTMDEAMRTYFMRYRFTHPTSEDFLRTIEEVAILNHRAAGTMTMHKDAPAVAFNTAYAWNDAEVTPIINSGLRPYFQQAVYGTAILDYAVDAITSDPVRWWEPKTGTKPMRNTVTVHRVGNFLLPVTLEVRFSDGTHLREYWDPADVASTGGVQGNDRWKTFTYVTSATVVSAEIDPDHTNLLDVSRFNNSRTAVGNPVPARKVTNLWLSLQQLSAQLAGWFV
jgi:hypothetical protein